MPVVQKERPSAAVVKGCVDQGEQLHGQIGVEQIGAQLPEQGVPVLLSARPVQLGLEPVPQLGGPDLDRLPVVLPGLTARQSGCVLGPLEQSVQLFQVPARLPGQRPLREQRRLGVRHGIASLSLFCTKSRFFVPGRRPGGDGGQDFGTWTEQNTALVERLPPNAVCV